MSPPPSSQRVSLNVPNKRNTWEEKAEENVFKFCVSAGLNRGAGQGPGDIAVLVRPATLMT